MTSVRRVQQWATYGRQWYLFDARWQNPFDSALKIVDVLYGKNKPIFDRRKDCGDHIVVVNSAHIALPGAEWERRVYFHNTGYAQGKTYTPAFQIHDRDKTMVLRKAVYSTLRNDLMRRGRMTRLHIFADEQVPEAILFNVNRQLRQLRQVPKRLDHYTEEEVATFPKVFDWPKQFVLK